MMKLIRTATVVATFVQGSLAVSNVCDQQEDGVKQMCLGVQAFYKQGKCDGIDNKDARSLNYCNAAQLGAAGKSCMALRRESSDGEEPGQFQTCLAAFLAAKSKSDTGSTHPNDKYLNPKSADERHLGELMYDVWLPTQSILAGIDVGRAGDSCDVIGETMAEYQKRIGPESSDNDSSTEESSSESEDGTRVYKGEMIIAYYARAACLAVK